MVDYGKMADPGKADAISTGAIEMAAPAITRKELLDRLSVDSLRHRMPWEITTSRNYGAAAAGCGSATISAPCGPAARMPALR